METPKSRHYTSEADQTWISSVPEIVYQAFKDASGRMKESTLILLDGMSEGVPRFEFVSRYAYKQASVYYVSSGRSRGLRRQSLNFRDLKAPARPTQQSIEIAHGLQINNQPLKITEALADNILFMENRRVLVHKIYSEIPPVQQADQTSSKRGFQRAVDRKRQETFIGRRKEEFLNVQQRAVYRRHVANWYLPPNPVFASYVTCDGLRRCDQLVYLSAQQTKQMAYNSQEPQRMSYTDRPVELCPSDFRRLMFVRPKITVESQRYGNAAIARNGPQFRRKYTTRREIVHLNSLKGLYEAARGARTAVWVNTREAE